MLPEPPLPAATAGPLCCFWAPDFSSPDSHTWALRPACKLGDSLGAKKGEKNLGRGKGWKISGKTHPLCLFTTSLLSYHLQQFLLSAFLELDVENHGKLRHHIMLRHKVQLCFTLIVVIGGIFSSPYHLMKTDIFWCFQGLVLDARLWWFGQCRAKVPKTGGCSLLLGRFPLKMGSKWAEKNQLQMGFLNKPY